MTVGNLFHRSYVYIVLFAFHSRWGNAMGASFAMKLVSSVLFMRKKVVHLLDKHGALKILL